MKVFLICFFIFSSLSGYCQVPEINNPVTHPHQINKYFVDSLNNKPIEFYLKHPKIDKYSKLFYKGEFAVSDNDLTFAFLDSVLTANPETKPFYLFVFNCVLRISDGAISEYISHSCRLFFEKYPCEFFDIQRDTFNSDHYERWIVLMAFDYSCGDDTMEVVNRKFKTVSQTVHKNCRIHITEIENLRLKIIKLIGEHQ